MVLLIIAGGVYSLKEINIEKYPNVDIPYLTVVIAYPGLSGTINEGYWRTY